MKRLSFLLLLFLGPAFLGTVLSCTKCKDSLLRYHIKSYDSQLGKRTSDGIVTIAPRDTIRSSELVLMLSGRLLYTNTMQVGGSWSAWACSPLEVPLDQIKAIKITSNQPYSADLPAGSDLSEWIQVADARRHFQSVPEFIKQESPQPEELLVRLLKVPVHAGLHQFTLQIDLGQVQPIVITTEPIYLTP